MIEGNLEISGLMSDETVTKFGHDFYDAFHRAWKTIESARYNIIIGERVDPIRGSLINLRLDQNVIYEGFLTPKLDEIKELATALAKEVNNLVRTRQNLESEPEY
jgi:curli production assembly/transport component CsgE